MKMKDETNDQRTILTMDTGKADDDCYVGIPPSLIYIHDASRHPMSLNSWRRIAPPPNTTNKKLPLLQDPNVKKPQKLTNITPVLIERKNKTLKQFNVAPVPNSPSTLRDYKQVSGDHRGVESFSKAAAREGATLSMPCCAAKTASLPRSPSEPKTVFVTRGRHPHSSGIEFSCGPGAEGGN